jgi:hypothetical protein
VATEVFDAGNSFHIEEEEEDDEEAPAGRARLVLKTTQAVLPGAILNSAVFFSNACVGGGWVGEYECTLSKLLFLCRQSCLGYLRYLCSAVLSNH